MKLHFTKMHALGNDFILIDARSRKLKGIPGLSRIICSRRFGVGADQLLLLYPSKKADFRMGIFNQDGSQAEMCGNGIRCLAKYIWDNKVKSSKLKVKSERLTIETLAGIINLQSVGKLIKVDMGEPILEPDEIPVITDEKPEDKKLRRWENENLLTSQPLNFSRSQVHQSVVINYPLKIKDKTFKITCVSMGNPHAVIFAKDVSSFPVTDYGHLIEMHKIFPKRTNVEFIQILNRSNIKMRVWERGAGETMACGTGASAAGVASVLLGLTSRKVNVHLQGGRLLIEWSEKDNHVYMTGPAVTVFEGTIEI